MDSIVINAPAKVNLFLRVVGKRPDGYHTIETLFEKIAFFDRIRLRRVRRDAVEVSSSGLALPEGEGNIAYRAAALIRARYKIRPGVAIEIAKAIPVASGLGGGSSDAAAVLAGINALFKAGIPERELFALAGELGADVPFFIAKDSWAIGRERGDKIESAGISAKLWHLLVVPPFGLFSKEAYEWADFSAKKDDTGINGILDALKSGNINAIGVKAHNDLEGLSMERDAGLRGLKERLLKNGALAALISGSGPVLVGVFNREEEVVALSEKLGKEFAAGSKGYTVLVAPTLLNKAAGCGN